MEYIRQNYQKLADLLESLVNTKNTSVLSSGRIPNVTLLRSLIAWAVINQREDEIMGDFKNLHQDLQIRLSEKSELIEQTIPARAHELAQRLADILKPLFLNSDGGGEQALLYPNRGQCVTSGLWIPTLRKTFLDALEIIVKLWQRETMTEFIWPEPGAEFNDSRLQAENNGTKLVFEGKTYVVDACTWSVQLDPK